MTTTAPLIKHPRFTPPPETRADLPPLDGKTTWHGIDRDLTAVTITPDALAGFYRLTVTHDGEPPRETLTVASWGMSANLDLLVVGVVSRWQAERAADVPPSDGDYANTPAIRNHLKQRGM